MPTSHHTDLADAIDQATNAAPKGVVKSYVVNLAGSNNDKGREVALQGQQRVQFHRRFRLAELRPREQGETQIDGGRVQGIGRARQIRSERFPSVEFDRLRNQDMREVSCRSNKVEVNIDRN